MADNRSQVMTLAKVLVAAAWADGQITDEERNNLKDIVYHLTDTGVQLTAQDWLRLEMYMDSPVGDAERERLVADLIDVVNNPSEKQYVIEALEQIARADGEANPHELEIIEGIESAIQGTDTGIMDGLNRLLGGALHRRSTALASAPNRDAYFDDFLSNKVYFEVNQRLQSEGKSLDLPDRELRIMGLAGGLMARIANVDRTITDEEFEAMSSRIAEYWSVDRETAVFIATVAVSSLDVNYDYYRMTREFGTETTLEERRTFLEVLFQVAAADGSVSFEETEEIRLVARGINVNHQDFIKAKMAVIAA